MAAQLPGLKLGERTYISREYFLAEAEKWLSPKDFALLCRADLNDFLARKDEPPLLREYKDFEAGLRTGLAALRKGVKEDIDYQLADNLAAALKSGTPLDKEKRFLSLRWDFIEQKEKEHYFDLEFIISYFLKLQILERLFIFDKEKGEAVFDALCAVNVPLEEANHG